MNKECCDIKVTELDDGYRIEIRGEGIKEKCKVFRERCCSDSDKWKEFVKCCFAKGE
jgi:hypothetical protein